MRAEMDPLIQGYIVITYSRAPHGLPGSRAPHGLPGAGKTSVITNVRCNQGKISVITNRMRCIPACRDGSLDTRLYSDNTLQGAAWAAGEQVRSSVITNRMRRCIPCVQRWIP
ncbi:hypothetical protein J6590_029665 [Homalodisca vitripennis]|nr:hypothetical protein J6590_029665 [Homalodisca vitripennis]